MKTEHAEEYLTKPEAAKLFKVSLRTIDTYMAQGVLPFYRFGRRTVRFKFRNLQAHIDSKCRVVKNVRARLRE